jgi:solute carrier family 25 (mitochondrial folate transporter), member 32
MATNS